MIANVKYLLNIFILSYPPFFFVYWHDLYGGNRMKIRMIFFILIFLRPAFSQNISFDRFFLDKTMRLDYFHTGTSDEEHYSYDEIVQEQFWAGSITNLVDTLNLGKYLFKIYDVKTNQLIYSRGFSSIFGEWQTTGEAVKGVWRSFSESVRFPWPKESVKLTIGTRDRENIFHDDWDFVIDPSNPNIRKSSPFYDITAFMVVNHGHYHQKVDIVFLPDGYTSKEMGKFRKDAKRFAEILFSASPFKERKQDFNIMGLELASGESGIDNPRQGVYKDNTLGCSYNAFGLDRYVLTWENKTMRRAASRVPYEHIFILVNEEKYGGGGIFNLYAITSVDNELSGHVFVHEFGHSFSGLGDEYYSSDVSYNDFYPPGIEPWEPNITALLDKDHVKWQNLMEPDTPIPTPWGKEEYETVLKQFAAKARKLRQQGASPARRDSLSAARETWLEMFIESQPYAGKIGVFEGAGYSAKGLYRPGIQCRMFSNDILEFDAVCRQALEKVIDFHIK